MPFPEKLGAVSKRSAQIARHFLTTRNVPDLHFILSDEEVKRLPQLLRMSGIRQLHGMDVEDLVQLHLDAHRETREALRAATHAQLNHTPMSQASEDPCTVTASPCPAEEGRRVLEASPEPAHEASPAMGRPPAPDDARSLAPGPVLLSPHPLSGLHNGGMPPLEMLGLFTRLSVEEEDFARREMIQSISDKIACSRATQQMHGIQSAASSTNEEMRLALEAFVRDDMTSAVMFLIEAIEPDVDMNRSDTLTQCVAKCVDYFEKEVGTAGALLGLWCMKNGDEREPTAEELKIVYDSIIGEGGAAMEAA